MPTFPDALHRLQKHLAYFLDRRGAQLEAPAAELPREEVEGKLRLVRHLLHEVELAARHRDCDWMLAGRQEGRQWGLQEGRQSGLQEGRLLALREVLLTLLEQRFGPLPEATRERVA